MHKTIRLAILCSILLYAAFGNAEQKQHYAYLDSKGRYVQLHLSEDYVALVPASESGKKLSTAEVTSELPRLKAGGLWQYRLADEFRGRQLEAAQQLLSRRVAVRAGLVFSIPGKPDMTFTLDRQVLVKLAKGASAQWVAERTGMVAIKPLDALEHVWLFRAQDAIETLDLSTAAAGLQGVEWALPDFGVPMTLYRQTNDTFFPNQWHLRQPSDADIDADEAWDVTMGDSQVVVAVVDTGVETSHPDFDPTHFVTGYNAVDDSNDPTPLSQSIDAHGTCCSGVIAAKADNGLGVAGICSGCSLMPIKMMDGMADETQLSTGYRALTYATEHGAWVISNSWGIEEKYIGQIDIAPYQEAVLDAVNNGRGGAGAVVLFASGNGNQWTGQGEPIGEHELQNMPEVMAVGGSGFDDTVVAYSDYGPNLSIVAPTGAIDMSNSQNPFSAPQIVTTDTTGEQGFSRGGYYYTLNPWTGSDTATDFAEIDASGDYTQMFNGTSAACPVAAGVVGLVLSAKPDLTAAQARFIVEQTADKHGGISFDANGHNDHYGYGRANAGRAVRAASLGLDNPPGSQCAENFNCMDDDCEKEDPSDFYGWCGGVNCSTLPDGSACSDSDPCTENDVCSAGTCTGTPKNCDDGNQCTDDSCDPNNGQCLHNNNNDVCDDSDLCTSNDTCSNGTCSGEAKDCNDGNICTDDSCDPNNGECLHGYNNSACDDGDSCTDNDTCSTGNCVGSPRDEDHDGHSPASCGGDDCDDSKATVYGGNFEGPYDNAICSDGLDNDCDGLIDSADTGCQRCQQDADCDDGNVCNGAESCQDGKCQTGTMLDCNDQNICTFDECDPQAGCRHEANAYYCDDGDPCTQNDICSMGQCQPGENTCTNTSQGGCNCTTGGRGHQVLWLIGLMAFLLRRRYSV